MMREGEASGNLPNGTDFIKETRRDGRVEMRMETTGLRELNRWVMSWMPDVRMPAPRACWTG